VPSCVHPPVVVGHRLVEPRPRQIVEPVVRRRVRRPHARRSGRSTRAGDPCHPFVHPPPKLSSASARTRAPARRMPTIGASFSVRSRTSTAAPVTSPCFGNFASASASSVRSAGKIYRIRPPRRSATAAAPPSKERCQAPTQAPRCCPPPDPQRPHPRPHPRPQQHPHRQQPHPQQRLHHQAQPAPERPSPPRAPPRAPAPHRRGSSPAHNRSRPAPHPAPWSPRSRPASSTAAA
jgi:hypothetical protein